MTKRWRVVAALAALAIATSVAFAGPANAAEPADAALTSAAGSEVQSPILVDTCKRGVWVPVWGGPRVKARTDGGCGIFEMADATEANFYVHHGCGDAICTVQRHGGKYFVFVFFNCDAFDLMKFGGRFDTHNHGSRGVWFYDNASPANVIAEYWGGRSDEVIWDPIFALKTCAF